MKVLYLRERGPMGDAPCIEPRLGGGSIFKVSLSHLDVKEHPGSYPHYLHNSNTVFIRIEAAPRLVATLE